MTIGEAARAAGVTPRMVRHYERLELVRAAGRSLGNYRTYDAQDVHTLRFIGRTRAAGLPLESIRTLVGLWQEGGANHEAPRIAFEHAAELRAKCAALMEVAAALQSLAEQCDGDGRPACPILDAAGLEGSGHDPHIWDDDP